MYEIPLANLYTISKAKTRASPTIKTVEEKIAKINHLRRSAIDRRSQARIAQEKSEDQSRVEGKFEVITIRSE